MHIVLVHGIFDNGAMFKPLLRTLEDAGHTCWAPALNPRDARHGVADLAEKLARYINTHLVSSERFAIIGFSMGCLVARYYLQKLSGAARTAALFAIAGPHRGTWTAYCYFGQGARDMRPNSRLLRELENTESSLNDLKIYTYWTESDVMIVPASSSCGLRAEESIRVRALLHRWMPRHRDVQRHILARLASLHTLDH